MPAGGSEASRVVYQPSISGTFAFSGELADSLAYSGRADATLGPTFTFPYGANTAPVALSAIAGLNPATSSVIVAWDRAGVGDFDLRTGLLAACTEEQQRRLAVAVEEPEAVTC